MLGNSIRPSLWGAVQQLPFFSSFRVAQRFRFDFIIPFALLTGLGLDNLLRLLKTQKFARPFSILVLLVVYADLTFFSTTNFLSKTLVIRNPESQLPRSATFFQTNEKKPDFTIQRTILLPDEFQATYLFEPYSYEYLRIKQNMGMIKCYDSITRAEGALGSEDQDYKGEYYLLEPVNGVDIQNSIWSPNRLTYSISNAENVVNNKLVINQNYYPGWIALFDDRGCERVGYTNGSLAVDLDAGVEKLTIEFNPLQYYLFCK